MRKGFVLSTLLALACGTSASADVVISTAPTQNITCSNGVCMPTAADAVLNVKHLERLLAFESVSIATTNGSVQANNIDITAPFAWSGPNIIGLTLDAYQSISFSAVVQNLSNGDISLVTNDGGTGGALSFAIGHGRLHTNAVSINGEAYKMASSVKQLAEMVVRKPHGHFALSRDVDAGNDGVYDTSPIPVTFYGAFNGLGHTVHALTIADTSDQGDYVALFSTIGAKGSVASVVLINAIVTTFEGNAAALAGENEGTVSNCFSSGRITGGAAGGLVGYNTGVVAASQSTASVHVIWTGFNGSGEGGGLVAVNGGSILASFATGDVKGEFHRDMVVGGLVGLHGFSTEGGTIENSYATGAVWSRGEPVVVGGAVGGIIAGSVLTSYSLGAVVAKSRGQEVGGFDGADDATITNSYWDTETSGQTLGSGDGNEAGLTGLTTQQFQSGLPAGFDPSIWAEDTNINNGFPYLIANPPAQ